MIYVDVRYDGARFNLAGHPASQNLPLTQWTSYGEYAFSLNHRFLPRFGLRYRSGDHLRECGWVSPQNGNVLFWVERQNCRRHLSFRVELDRNHSRRTNDMLICY